MGIPTGVPIPVAIGGRKFCEVVVNACMQVKYNVRSVRVQIYTYYRIATLNLDHESCRNYRSVALLDMRLYEIYINIFSE